MFLKQSEKQVVRRATRAKSWRLIAAAVPLCAVGAVALQFANATFPVGFASTNVVGPVLLDEIHTKSETDDHIRIKSKGLTDVYVTSITIVPGGHGGWHSHPGPSIITVKSGTATFYDECDDPIVPHVYPAGTGFVEDAGCVHLLANEGDISLEVVVVQLVPFGAPRRIDEDAPN
jgi:quercetin dioxygenase-like cupin family protein